MKNRGRTLRLVAVPVLISAAVTALRLTGELLRWSGNWFSTETGGTTPHGYSWIVGITWLPIFFGPYFATALWHSGDRPKSFSKAVAVSLAGCLVAEAGTRLDGSSREPSLPADPARHLDGLCRRGRHSILRLARSRSSASGIRSRFPGRRRGGDVLRHARKLGNALRLRGDAGSVPDAVLAEVSLAGVFSSARLLGRVHRHARNPGGLSLRTGLDGAGRKGTSKP